MSQTSWQHYSDDSLIHYIPACASWESNFCASYHTQGCQYGEICKFLINMFYLKIKIICLFLLNYLVYIHFYKILQLCANIHCLLISGLNIDYFLPPSYSVLSHFIHIKWTDVHISIDKKYKIKIIDFPPSQSQFPPHSNLHPLIYSFLPKCNLKVQHGMGGHGSCHFLK